MFEQGASQDGAKCTDRKGFIFAGIKIVEPEMVESLQDNLYSMYVKIEVFDKDVDNDYCHSCDPSPPQEEAVHRVAKTKNKRTARK